MVGFIQNDQIPRCSTQQLIHALLTADQVTGGQNQILGIPGIARGLQGLTIGVFQDTLGVAPEVEIEFFAEFFLPLGLHAGRGQDQHPSHFLGNQQIAENQPSLDGFAQANFIGN